MNQKVLVFLLGLISLSYSIHTYSSIPLSCFPGNGLTTVFYSTMDFKEPASAIELTPQIDQDFGVGTPHPTITNVDKWSIYYSGIFTPNVTGNYIFMIESDDGARINLDGSKIVGSFNIQNFPLSSSDPVSLDAGHPYLFTVDFYENLIKARIRVSLQHQDWSAVLPSFNLEPCDLVPAPIETFDCSSSPNGLEGLYYDTFNFLNLVDAKVDTYDPFVVNYGAGKPTSVTDPDNFSILWKGAFNVLASGRYRIGVNSVEKVKVRIGNIVVIDNGVDLQEIIKTGPIMQLDSGEYYSIEIEYQETGGDASFELLLSHIDVPGSIVTIPLSQLKACFPPGIVVPQRVSTTGLFSVEIPVSLRAQPLGLVQVFVINPLSGSITALPCVLSFDETNWNIPQIVTAIATTTSESLGFVSQSAADQSYNSLESTTYITGDYVPCDETPANETCYSWGDPHLITFDDNKQTFQSSNDFYLVRSYDSEFVVQIRQQKCGTNALACNYAAAIKYGDAMFRIVVDPITGLPTADSNGKEAGLGASYSLNIDGTNFIYDFPNKVEVRVYAIWWAKAGTYFMNVLVTLPWSYKEEVTGLCGNFDNNKANDLQDKTGKVVGLGKYISAWIIPANENIITGGFGVVIPQLTINGVIPDSPSLEDPICEYPLCPGPAFFCDLTLSTSLGKAGDIVVILDGSLDISKPVSCKFGDTVVPAKIVGPFTIECQVPPGTGTVSVFVIQGLLGEENCFVPFTYDECPTPPPPPPNQCEESQFGFEASLFNAIIFDSMSTTGNVGGRLAVGDDLIITYSSIGDYISPAKTCDEMDLSDWRYALVVGGKISWSQTGSVNYGSIAYGDTPTSIPNSVLNSLSDGCQAVLLANVLNFNLIESYLQLLSAYLSTMTPTGKSVYNFGLYLTPSGKTDYEVFDVSAPEVQNPYDFFLFDTTTLSPTATIIINVSGESCGFSGSYDSLIPVRNRVLWNFYECTSLSAAQVSIQGSLLAPYADLPSAEGYAYGQVFVKSWCGGMDIEYDPFQGCLPILTLPE